jgi:hypothetical protein
MQKRFRTDLYSALFASQPTSWAALAKDCQSFRHVLGPWEESSQYPYTPNPVKPTKSSFNAGAGHCNSDAENSKLLLYVILVSIDGFVGRIDNKHLANTIHSSLALWSGLVTIISLCFLKNQDLRQCLD